MLDRISTHVTEDMKQQFPSELYKMYHQLRGDVEGVFAGHTNLVSPDIGGKYEIARVALLICDRNLRFLRAQFNHYNEHVCDENSVGGFPFEWPERSI